MLLAVQKTYGKSEEANYTNASAVSTLMMTINNDWIGNNTTMAFVGAVLYGAQENWYTYQQEKIAAAKSAATDATEEEGAEDAGEAEDDAAEEESDLAEENEDDSFAL